MKIWVLMTGEDQGGSVEGLFATRAEGKRAYLRAVSGLPLGPADMTEILDDGGQTVLYEAEAGCDWVSLELHEVSE